MCIYTTHFSGVKSMLVFLYQMIVPYQMLLIFFINSDNQSRAISSNLRVICNISKLDVGLDILPFGS